jgi:hypothetical protein
MSYVGERPVVQLNLVIPTTDGMYKRMNAEKCLIAREYAANLGTVTLRADCHDRDGAIPELENDRLNGHTAKSTIEQLLHSKNEKLPRWLLAFSSDTREKAPIWVKR